jgi:Rieske Fe-S protein
LPFSFIIFFFCPPVGHAFFAFFVSLSFASSGVKNKESAHRRAMFYTAEFVMYKEKKKNTLKKKRSYVSQPEAGVGKKRQDSDDTRRETETE